MAKTQSAVVLPWPELCKQLLETTDERLLEVWLTEARKEGKLYKIRRIYGRLAAVRRDRELLELGIGA